MKFVCSSKVLLLLPVTLWTLQDGSVSEAFTTSTTSSSKGMLRSTSDISSSALFATIESTSTSVSSSSSSNSEEENDDDTTTIQDIEFPPPLGTMDRFKRAATFWSTAVPIVAQYYGIIGKTKMNELLGRKMTPAEIETLWATQHEAGAAKLRDTITDLKGFYVKTAQIISARQDLFPKQYTDALSCFTDNVDPMPTALAKAVVAKELLTPGETFSDVFLEFDDAPLGAASVAQVHRAVLTEKYGGPREVAVKIQRPSIESKLMGDIANLKALAKQFQDLEALPLDYYTVFCELEKQLGDEFYFVAEASAMDRIYTSLARSADGTSRRELPLVIPRVVPGLVSKRVLVMDYLHGVPLSRCVFFVLFHVSWFLGCGISCEWCLDDNVVKHAHGADIFTLDNVFIQHFCIYRARDEMLKKGIDPEGPEAKLFGRRLLTALSEVFGRNILETGFFHADPHPGNIFVLEDGSIGLIDFGQVKQISGRARETLCKVMIALDERPENLDDMTDEDMALVGNLALELGVKLNDDAKPLAPAAIAMWLFDGSVKELPGGYDTGELSPNSPVRELASFPQDLVLVGRSTILVKGLSDRLGIPWSLAKEWAPIARAVLDGSAYATKPTSENSDRVRFREVWNTMKLWGSGRVNAVARELPDPVRSRVASIALKLEERRARRKVTRRS